MRAIFLGTPEEITWAFLDGPSRFRPELYAQFVALLPADERADPLAAYVSRLANPDPDIHLPAARIWNAYERALSELAPPATDLEATSRMPGPRPPTPFVEAHYIRNLFFLQPDQLVRQAGRLHAIPGVIVQGRYDLVCPPVGACRIAAAWPACRLQLIDQAGHAMTEPGVMDALRRAVAELSGF